MRVPSYDDLTPPIEDVSPADVFGDVVAVLPSYPSSRVEPVAREGSGSACALFACLRGPADAIFAVAKDFSPRVQRCGPSAVVLDVSGLGRLLGDADAIARELHREARERSKRVHVAVAPTQASAVLLAYGQTALTPQPVIAADIRPLAALPLAVLRQAVEEAYAACMTAACASAFDVLRRWGLATIGEFAALPAVQLSERLGQAGVWLQRLACGIDAAPLVADPGVPRFVQAIELEWPIEQLEALSFVLARLLDPLSAALERADRGAAAIRLDLRLVDRTTHARVLQLPAAMRDPRVLRTLVLLDLESHPPQASIDIVTIEVDPAPARIIQYSLLERARPTAETIATLNARLNALVGETRCGAAVLLDTHRPDGFAMQRFAPPEKASPHLRSDVARDSVAGPLLRRFRPPVAVRVTVDRGRPVSVAIDRRGMPGGRIERAAGPWRTSGGWWDDGAAQWDRDEWDVALAGGTLCRLVRERMSARWFMDALID